MKIAEYATDRGLVIQRVLSVCVLVAVISVSYKSWGLHTAGRALLLFAPATAAIWFAEAFSREGSAGSSISNYPRHPDFSPKSVRFIRFSGWLVLLGAPILIFLFFGM